VNHRLPYEVWRSLTHLEPDLLAMIMPWFTDDVVWAISAEELSLGWA
jgi:hypothetical protein